MNPGLAVALLVAQTLLGGFIGYMLGDMAAMRRHRRQEEALRRIRLGLPLDKDMQ